MVGQRNASGRHDDHQAVGNSHVEQASSNGSASQNAPLRPLSTAAGPETSLPGGEQPCVEADCPQPPASQSSADEPMPGQLADAPMIAHGTIVVGPMYARRERFERIEDPDLRELLSRSDLPIDAVIEAEDGSDFQVLDLDTHDWPAPPSPQELAAHAAAMTPAPDAWWISHGGGLKALYTGTQSEPRALAAAFTAPRGFSVEVLRHTRHPCSHSSSHPGRTCG